jgi:hypothetical protein
VLHDTDVARLTDMRAAREALFAQPLTLRENGWRTEGPRAGVRTIVLRTPQSLSLLDLSEAIEQGQRVAAWRVSTVGPKPQLLASGTTIGHRQLCRIPATTVSAVTLRVETVDAVQPVALRLFA